jgi:hypothetical protein
LKKKKMIRWKVVKVGNGYSSSLPLYNQRYVLCLCTMLFHFFYVPFYGQYSFSKLIRLNT